VDEEEEEPILGYARRLSICQQIVALATLEKKVVTKYNIFLRPKHFLVVEGYDPRIHSLYYCPQLYKYDGDKRLVPLEGEEIGRLVAKAVQNGVVEKQPWYPPSEMLPPKPIIDGKMDIDFDSMVVDAPASKAPDSVRSPTA
jgi:hypothetical protein